MDLALVSAGGNSGMSAVVAVLMVSGALVFLVFRARSQGRAQRSSERQALDSFAGLRDTDLDSEPWAVPLLSDLSDSPASGLGPEELLRPQDWSGVTRGQYRRLVLSATNLAPIPRHIILMELSQAASDAPALAIEPVVAVGETGSGSVPSAAGAERWQESHGGVDVNANARPLQALTFGDDALDRAWAVRCLAPEYARTVIDIAMRGRLFGLDARGMRLAANRRALAASFPAPASVDLVRDRLILLTEFADRIELHAGTAPANDGLAPS